MRTDRELLRYVRSLADALEILGRWRTVLLQFVFDLVNGVGV